MTKSNLHAPCTVQSVTSFKELTDENMRVAQILRSEFRTLLSTPILDVGSGMGDISGLAWPDLDVTLLDSRDFGDFPSSNNHQRILGDFFSEGSLLGRHYQTLLFIHVLQYLDDDLARLSQRVSELHPSNIIVVINDADDPFMCDLLRFARENIDKINPERDSYQFENFIERKRVAFVSEVSASNFCELASNFFAIVLDRNLNETECAAVAGWLRNRLPDGPFVKMRQSVVLFQRA